MTVSIHQPNFIPWLGYFYKISCSTLFVMLDDVQYTKNSFINRNKIKMANGANWVTLPVTSGALGRKINEARYFEKESNIKKIKKAIELNYRKAGYFDQYYGPFCSCLDFGADIVSVFNAHVVQWLMEQFDIKTRAVQSSELGNAEGASTARLIEICKSVGADTYLSGTGGANYQDDELYASNGIRLVYSKFVHPAYAQPYGDFIPNMSAIDYLFNCGPAARELFIKP